MGADWIEVSLGDLIDVKHGFAFKGEFFRDKPPGDILLTPGNFAIGGGFKGDKFKYYDGPVSDEYVLSKGDLIVTMTDLSKTADTLGYSAFVPSQYEGRRYLHNQRIGKILFKNPEATDIRYLHYLLHDDSYRNEIVAGATGSTVKHTSPDRIKRFRFKLPPISEQRVIGHALGRLDEKIDLNRRINETLEAIARALFKSWFVDFDPVRAKASGEAPESICKRLGLTPEILALFPDRFQESELGEIPEGWLVKNLDQIADYLNGLALQKYPVTGDESLPVVKIAQLRAGHTRGADRAGVNVPADYIVEDGDILFSWSGSLEVDIWAGGRGALNQHLFKVSSTRYPKWFYYFWTKEHLTEFRGIAANKATTMGHIQRKHLSSAKVVVPHGSLLEKMTKLAAPLINKQIEVRVESSMLAVIRDALLPKLLSGDIRIPMEAVKLE